MALLRACNVLSGWENAYWGDGLPRKLAVLHQLIVSTPDSERDPHVNVVILAVDLIDEDQERELVTLSGRCGPATVRAALGRW